MKTLGMTVVEMDGEAIADTLASDDGRTKTRVDQDFKVRVGYHTMVPVIDLAAPVRRRSKNTLKKSNMMLLEYDKYRYSAITGLNRLEATVKDVASGISDLVAWTLKDQAQDLTGTRVKDGQDGHTVGVIGLCYAVVSDMAVVGATSDRVIVSLEVQVVYDENTRLVVVRKVGSK